MITTILEENKRKKTPFLYINYAISSLPRQIGELSHLKVLDLSHNSLESLPKEIGNLTNLEILDLRNNKLEYLPIEICLLKKLKSLYVSSNKLKELPCEILNLTSLIDLEIDKNPIMIPPLEICVRGIPAIYNYFKLIENSGEREKVYEAKLLIVGEGNVGKTCLMNALLTKDDETKTTEGIDIQKWNFNNNNIDYKVNIWDFGGQEIYHATHQFFLTKRSLYLFVWNARTDDYLMSFDYWLNVIKLIGAEAPVIIVQNKIDERIKGLDESQISRNFNNIKGFINVSALQGTNIDNLISQIQIEIQKLDHIGDTLPKVWNEIRQRLESFDLNYISHNDYLSLCNEYGLNKSQSDYISQYYHDIGVFLHFQESTVLNEKIFLKPEWATNAVYKLIDNKEVIVNYGKFHFSDLNEFWSDYSVENFIYLVELMKKFELCFQLADTDIYIIPELVSAIAPKFEWDYSENIILKFGYDFMPKGIITRFIVRNHDIIDNNIFWKNGIILKRNNTSALLICDDFKREIEVRIGGYDKYSLLSIIQREIDYIHKTLNYPNVMTFIPCCCKECKINDNPHFFNRDTINRYVEKNKKSILCPKSVEEVELNIITQNYDKNVPKGYGKGLELSKRLIDCIRGQKDWRAYELLCKEIFEFLFKDDFNSFTFSEQSSNEKNNLRRDLLVNNNYSMESSVWSKMFHQYNSKIIVLEFKNYKEKITQEQLLTTQKYLNKNIGYFGIIFSRMGLDKNAIIFQSQLLDENKLLLSLKDSDLSRLLDSKMKGQDPKLIIEELIFDIQLKK
jgi:internalin A